jgi:heme oxygenase (biliverdin-producing, ferredoxin)
MMGRHPRSATITDPAASPLSQHLRSATRDLHRAAEASQPIRALLRGELGRGAYAALLWQLHALYEALEQGLDRHADTPGFAAFGFAPLRRLPALSADLRSLHEPRAAAQPATQALVSRLHGLAADDPPRLLAHAYVRYLGDLNGGQLLSRAVQASPALAAAGTAFYRFDEAAPAIGRFRAALDALPAALAQPLVDEACWSFEQHRRLFDELAAV